MSRSAVSEEHFAIAAHFDVVSLPWNSSNNRLTELRNARARVRPVQKRPAWDPCCRRAMLEANLPRPTASGREERRVPSEQSFRRQRLPSVPRRIEHHLDHAFDSTIDDVEAGDGDAEAAGDGRADLPGVELLALDLAALDRFLGQRFQSGFLLKREAVRLHATEQPPLLVTHRANSQRLGRHDRTSTRAHILHSSAQPQCHALEGL